VDIQDPNYNTNLIEYLKSGTHILYAEIQNSLSLKFPAIFSSIFLNLIQASLSYIHTLNSSQPCEGLQSFSSAHKVKPKFVKVIDTFGLT
jgi:hypothetical protein